MSSVTRAVCIAAVILFVLICFFGWTFQGVLFACGYGIAASVPIIIVMGILLALLELFGK